MRNNKGYSLVELLVTLAVFSIVMVSIVTLMSTTASTYGKGQRETEVQEEAQIVANQIENFVIDATGPVINDPSTGGYKIPQPSGSAYCYLKQDGNKIMYSDNGSVWAPLADYVKSFSIKNDSNTDNKVAISVEMANGKETIDPVTGLSTGEGQAKYAFEKTVYYRNQVENLANFTIAEGSSPTTTSGGSNEYTLNVRRFEKYNLKALKDIDHFEKDPTNPNKVVVHGTAGDVSNFICENKKFNCSGANGNEQLDGAFVRCSDITNTDFSTSVAESANCYVNGYTKDGTLIKVKLVLDPVYFSQGSGVFILPQKKEISGQYGSRGLVVDAYGINMYEAIKAGVVASCDITIYSDADGNSNPGGSETKVEFSGKTMKCMSGDSNDFSSTPGQSNFPGFEQMNIGICADMNNGGIAMCSNNGFQATGSVGATIKSKKMRYRVEMSFSKGGSGIACSTGFIDVAIRVPGYVD